jgi:deoxycytidine triphosphate deaminase
MLSDKQIKDLISQKEIKITPFDKKNLGPVSYDLSTVSEYISRGVRRLVTRETIQLSKAVAGIICLRSRGALRGLFWSGSQLVDPGYKGKLLFLVYDPVNPNKDYDSSDLFQIMFFRVGAVEVPYDERPASTAMNREGFNKIAVMSAV